MTKHKQIDTSNELLLQRWSGGFMLVRPDKSRSSIQPSTVLSEIFEKSFDVYLYNLEHYFQMVNEEFVKTGDLNSVASIVGKNVHDIFPKESQSLIKNNLVVLSTMRTQISEEEILLTKEISQQYISIKSPLYNENSQLIGIFGCSILLGTPKVADSLQEITNLGMLTMSMTKTADLKSNLARLSFSKRERDCLYLLVRGKTAKEIARILNLSSRTVEVYLDKIKIKTGMTSRSELIENLMYLFS